MGGRGISSVQEYNPVKKSWLNKGKPPLEIRHFQAVTLHGLVYAVAGMRGPYPHEVPLRRVYVYNPLSDKWFAGSVIRVSLLF